MEASSDAEIKRSPLQATIPACFRCARTARWGSRFSASQMRRKPSDPEAAVICRAAGRGLGNHDLLADPRLLVWREPLRLRFEIGGRGGQQRITREQGAALRPAIRDPCTDPQELPVALHPLGGPRPDPQQAFMGNGHGGLAHCSALPGSEKPRVDEGVHQFPFRGAGSKGRQSRVAPNDLFLGRC